LVSGEFVRFGLVGVVGFLVDAGALTLAVGYSFDLYSARVISFSCAVTTTWFLNRVFTFRSTSANLVGQWARFALVNAIGGLLNYGTYALLVWQVALVSIEPIIGVAAGSIVGMIVNFTLSKHYVFNQKL